MKNIGYLSGRFDPIHNGHLMAGIFAKQYGLDSVYFDTVFHSNRKNCIESYHHRQEMVKIAIENNNHSFEAFNEDMKIYNNFGRNPSNVERAGWISSLFNGNDLFWVTTIDTIPGYIERDELTEMLEYVNILVIKRKDRNVDIPNFDDDSRVILLQEEVDGSSFKMRKLINENGNLTGFIPCSVIKYISTHELYKGKPIIPDKESN